MLLTFERFGPYSTCTYQAKLHLLRACSGVADTYDLEMMSSVTEDM